MRFLSVISLGAVLALGACGSPVHPDFSDAQYWQRVSMSDAIYAQGPKAQQMLHRDIGRCVVELNELERLGELRDTIPLDPEGRVADPDDLALRKWDTPDRDQNLYAEHTDYHDFESCMLSKGWERAEYLPYDIAERARGNYLRAHKSYEYQSRYGKKTQSSGPYKDLNQ